MSIISFKKISKIFQHFLYRQRAADKLTSNLDSIIGLCIKTNKRLWDLEDSARMVEFGSEHVATVKWEIDRNNMIRNDLIRQIDLKIVKQLEPVISGPDKEYHSETPGMMIDRLSILFIKQSVIRRLLSVIKEVDLKKEYTNKEKIILKQIEHLGGSVDVYLGKLAEKKITFEPQQPVKIYDDKRVKKYIKLLRD